MSARVLPDRHSTLRKPRPFAMPIQSMPLVVCAANPLQAFLTRYSQPQKQPEYDMHYAVEVGVVRSGRMRRLYDGFRLDCGPGEIWFCGMLEPHGVQVLKAPCEVFVMVAWPPMFSELRFPEAPGLNWMAPFLLPPAQRPRPSALERRQTLQVVNRLVVDQSLPDIRQRVQMRLHLLELLIPFALRGSVASRNAPREPALSNRIAPALALLDGCRERVGTGKAARCCGLSPEVFAQEFRSLMCLSFVQFNLRRRLNGVAGELAAGDMPIKAVARDWGFTDNSHLDRQFSRHYGCTPQQYRERHCG